MFLCGFFAYTFVFKMTLPIHVHCTCFCVERHQTQTILQSVIVFVVYCSALLSTQMFVKANSNETKIQNHGIAFRADNL